MKKLLFGVAIGALALTSTAFLKSSALDSFVTKLHNAEGVNVKYSVTEIGQATKNYHVILAKPNKAKMVLPDRTVVADGENITTYWASKNEYTKVKQTDAQLRALFTDGALNTWLPFFDIEAFKGLASVKDSGTRKRGKVNYKVVDAIADAKGETQMTYYVDSADSIIKQGTITVKAAGKETTSVFNATEVNLTAPGEGAFALNLPSGAKELKPGDFASGIWIHDFKEAIGVAKSNDKLMMVDFYAVWCGPCKLMAAEAFTNPKFKDATKDMVLAKIDAEKDVMNAKKYGVSAYPTVKFINGNGDLVHEFVGYGGVGHVLSEVAKAKQKFGK